MRSIILTLIALVIVTNAIGQTLNNQQKLVEYLGQERFDELQTSNPSYLQFLDIKCSKGFDVIELASEKTQNMPVLNDIEKIDPNQKFHKTPNTISASDFVQLFENGSLNFLMYQLQGDRYEMRYYVLGNTGKVLMIYPTDYISQLVNNK